MNQHIVSTFPYHVIASNGTVRPYPYIVDTQGKGTVRCIGARHGRSFVVGKHADGRYIVSKGNGLSYSGHPFLYTPEMPTDVWGLLLREDALRDFYCGQDVQAFGIKTNQMECVLELLPYLYSADRQAPKARTLAVFGGVSVSYCGCMLNVTKAYMG